MHFETDSEAEREDRRLMQQRIEKKPTEVETLTATVAALKRDMEWMLNHEEDWTHFAQVPSLTHEEARRLADGMSSTGERS